MDNVSVNQTKKRPDRHGSNNPMWNRHHSIETRQKQSDAAKRRSQQYKQALDSQHHVTMDEFLSNNPTVEEYIKTLVKEQIDKFIWTECKQSKPKQLPLNIWL
jgi:hypothetical protein